MYASTYKCLLIRTSYQDILWQTNPLVSNSSYNKYNANYKKSALLGLLDTENKATTVCGNTPTRDCNTPRRSHNSTAKQNGTLAASRKSTNTTLSTAHASTRDPPATGRDKPMSSSQSQHRQSGSDPYKYRAKNTKILSTIGRHPGSSKGVS
jgi:hypothetical protein